LQFTRALVADGAGTNYLLIRRADFHEVGADAAALAAARLEWLQAYLPVMQTGFAKKLGVSELEPGNATRSAVRIQLPD
jgi:hypothetical protein